MVSMLPTLHDNNNNFLFPAELTGFNCSPIYKHGLTLIPTWISDYIHYNVWDEITYPFLNLHRWSLGMDKACDYLSMLGLKLKAC